MFIVQNGFRSICNIVQHELPFPWPTVVNYPLIQEILLQEDFGSFHGNVVEQQDREQSLTYILMFLLSSADTLWPWYQQQLEACNILRLWFEQTEKYTWKDIFSKSWIQSHQLIDIFHFPVFCLQCKKLLHNVILICIPPLFTTVINCLSHILLFLWDGALKTETQACQHCFRNMVSLRVTLPRLGTFLFSIPVESVVSVNVFMQPNPTEAKAGQGCHLFLFLISEEWHF